VFKVSSRVMEAPGGVRPFEEVAIGRERELGPAAVGSLVNCSGASSRRKGIEPLGEVLLWARSELYVILTVVAKRGVGVGGVVFVVGCGGWVGRGGGGGFGGGRGGAPASNGNSESDKRHPQPKKKKKSKKRGGPWKKGGWEYSP